jgi:hypothetical protein
MSAQTRTFKLTTGLEHLEDWSGGAGQAHKNILYKALFTVPDGSVFYNYGVLRAADNPFEFFVLIREDLVLKISFPDESSFGILYIGPLEGAPGLDLALEGT